MRDGDSSHNESLVVLLLTLSASGGSSSVLALRRVRVLSMSMRAMVAVPAAKEEFLSNDGDNGSSDAQPHSRVEQREQTTSPATPQEAVLPLRLLQERVVAPPLQLAVVRGPEVLRRNVRHPRPEEEKSSAKRIKGESWKSYPSVCVISALETEEARRNLWGRWKRGEIVKKLGRRRLWSRRLL